MPIYQKHNSLSTRGFNSVTYTDLTFESHFHKNTEFLYVIDGEISLTVENSTESADKGSVIIIPPMLMHSFATPNSSKVWIGVFSNDYIREFCPYIKNRHPMRFHYKTDNAVSVENLISKIPIMNDFEIKGFLYSLCGNFVRLCTPSEIGHVKSDLYSRIIEYVSENFRKDITLDSVSSALGYEMHYISKIIHENSNVNFRQLLNSYRIELAKELILDGENSVYEISFKCGFNCVRSFNRAFNELLGTEPQNYISSLQK